MNSLTLYPHSFQPNGILKCPICPDGAGSTSDYMHLGPVAVLQNTDCIHVSYGDRAPKLRHHYEPNGMHWRGKTEPAAEPLLGTGDIQSLADLGNSFEIIRKMRILPVELSDFIAFVLPGLIPALPLAATVMPLGEIVKNLLKLIA